MKTQKLTVPAEALLDFLRTVRELPADARIVGTGWDRVFDENRRPFAQAIFLYIESAEFESGEEPEV
jgi:type IV secretory pathway TrbF-like protein